MPFKDPEKRREYKKEWHKRNRRPKDKQTSLQRKKDIARKARQMPCFACKQEFHYCAMDLHHVDPSQKEKSISTLIKSGGYEALENEIKKCVPLCSNCHRLVHNNVIELKL